MYTLSWHQEGQGKVNQSHNRREFHAIGKDSDIDLGLTPNNITLIDVPIREAYHKLFDASVVEYNSRARASRQISDYYTYIGKSNKQQAYEAIIQLGSKAEGSPAKAVEAFKQYVSGWKTRNPNMVLIGAYIHLDEPEGTPHLHIDYIPAARCNRGMKLQNSLTRALAAQGFKTCKQEGKQVTAQIQWEQSERDCMREICRNIGIDLHEQGIGRKRHLSVKEYKDCMEQISEARRQLSRLDGQMLISEFEQQALIQESKRLESEKLDLQKRISALSLKRQMQHEGLQQDQVAWSEFRESNFGKLEWLEAFQDCVKHYEPDFFQTVTDFLSYEGLNPEDWPDSLYLESEQCIDNSDLEL